MSSYMIFFIIFLFFLSFISSCHFLYLSRKKNISCREFVIVENKHLACRLNLIADFGVETNSKLTPNCHLQEKGKTGIQSSLYTITLTLIFCAHFLMYILSNIQFLWFSQHTYVLHFFSYDACLHGIYM